MTDKSASSRLFDGVNGLLLLLFALITVVPFIHVIASSFATQKAYTQSNFILFPTEFSMNAYKYIFSNDLLLKSLLLTVFITVAGTTINIVCTSLFAYSLSRKKLHFRKTIMFFIVFTIIYQAGLIPDYLVVKELGFLNTYWSLMVPRAIIPFYLIILISFFKNIPDEIEESGRIDGCGDLRMLLQIVMPLSKPALATLILFYAVFHWNTYMHAILYLNDAEKWPIQVLLRQIVFVTQSGLGDSPVQDVTVPPDTVKMAVIAVATFPILLVYPFLQKYFARGILLGSVKG